MNIVLMGHRCTGKSSVGMLVAAPMMLTVVWIVDRSQGQYERGANQKSGGRTRHKS